jgi:hypothetical protein
MAEAAHDYSAYMGSADEQALDKLNVLAEEQHLAEKEVLACEEALKAAQVKLRDIAEHKLPEYMDSLGLEIFKTKKGLMVNIKEKVRASISADNKPKAFSWMEGNGFGGLIKRTVIVGFGRDQSAQAKELTDKLKEEYPTTSFEQKVETSTLQAFVREQLAAGSDIPVDIFGVFRQRISVIE